MTRRTVVVIAGIATLTCGALVVTTADADKWLRFDLTDRARALDGQVPAPPRSAHERPRFYLSSAGSTLIQKRLAAPQPTGAEAAGFEQVPPPRIEFRPDVSQATTAPWIDLNGARFQRGLKKAHYAKLPAGSAPLAAAEAYTYGVDAILNPDPSDLDALGSMLQFLNAQSRPPLPVMANVGVVDDGSAQMGEILNLLTRRNLLYRVVAAPDRTLNLTVQLGTAEFPKEAAADPYAFAARVRAKIGDDNRLIRLYGTSTVVAHLTGDGTRLRLYLLSYGGRGRQQRGQPSIRVRVVGRYEPVAFAAYGTEADAKLTDVDNPGKTTEFSVPSFVTIAMVDLRAR